MSTIRCRQRFQFIASSSSLWQQQNTLSTSTSFASIVNDIHNNKSGVRYLISTVQRFMSSGSSRRPIRVALPKFGQNGTLVLRNDSNANINISNVQIITQWRDDAMIELIPYDCSSTADSESRASGVVDEVEEIATAFENTSEDSVSTTTTQEIYGPMQFTNHTDGIVTSLGRKGSLVEVDILDTEASLNNSDNDNNNNKQKMKLIATIPEKSNLTCQLNNSGDINIDGKLEGDTHLSTNGGNITVSKLRGHHVSLNITTSSLDDGNINNIESLADSNLDGSDNGGIIHVKKAIEAKSVHIETFNRVRAQMLNGSNVTINVKRPSSNKDAKKSSSSMEESFTKLDEDDEGALIDVGSLYISSSGGGSESSNEAHLLVEDFNGRGSDEGLVRVKSCHGHVTVHAKKTGTTKEDDQQLTHQKNQSSPLVDIGGVNGSCDITLEALSSDDNINIANNNNNNNNNTVATGTRVHFDAMTPDSISTITSRGSGNHSTSITMDRKLETEVRMMSVAKSTLPIEFDAYSLTSDNADDVHSTLKSVSDAVVSKHPPPDDNMGQAISIETDAFKEDTSDQQQQMTHECIEYTQGTMSNRSGEPDSRFDVRTQSSSRGKINIDGAASQALNSFKKQSSSSSSGDEMADPSLSDATLPLLAVATDGTIKLETLSWFGSIARRYGMDEEKNDRKVGRQASRKPRLG